ncbi:MAG: transcriptional regulator [Piscinibacter sp.]|nr:transcriptional regulator [Piscinibacter sp.]
MDDAPRLPATKIQPPRLRSRRIPRPALEAELAAALLERRLVLVAAPAGFGKTAALTGALERLPAGTAVAWVSLDEDDDTPRLFEALAAALEPFDLPWRTAPQALAAQVGDAAEGTRRALAELVNALAGAEAVHGVVVLDDLHRVQSPPLQAFLESLIERLPARWTLALASRVEPPLALARWRVADELAEFGEAAMRFSDDESAALIAAEQPGALDALGDAAAGLVARTRGWPAGLRLCLAALRQRPALAATLAAHGRAPLVDRQLFDYLAAEVLDDMPIGLHDFLLRCSVLPALTAARCAQVSGDARAAQWLEEIERRGLFVSTLDDAQRTLVLHDLFRDALEDRLRRRLADELPALLQRAAASEPDPVRRIGFLLRAADWPAAEAALAVLAPELLLTGQGGELQRLAGQFPDPWRATSARLLRLQALARVQRWDWDGAAVDLRAALRAARARADADETALAQAYLANVLPELGRHDEEATLLADLRGQPRLPTEAHLLLLLGDCSRRFLAGDLAALPGLYSEVVDRLEQVDVLQTWWENAPPMSWSTLRGMRPVLERYSTGLLRRVGERELPLRALAHSQLAYVHLWAGRVEQALGEVRRAEADARWLAVAADVQANVSVLCLLVEAMLGHAEIVRLGLDGLLRGEQGSPERRRVWTYQVAIFGLRLTDLLGPDPDGLRHWSALLSANAPERPPEGGGSPSLAPARLAAAEGRWEDAAQGFAAALPNAPRLDQMGQAVELQLRCAQALARCGRVVEATAALRPALQRIAAEGELGHALMAGPAVLQELAEADWIAALPDAERAVLSEASGLARRLRQEAVPSPASSPTPTLVDAAASAPVAPASAGTDPLSEREREVLARIAAGDSNKVIARVLDISPHTVKRHVANILDKLALGSRGQAAAWWRAHP